MFTTQTSPVIFERIKGLTRCYFYYIYNLREGCFYQFLIILHIIFDIGINKNLYLYVHAVLCVLPHLGNEIRNLFFFSVLSSRCLYMLFKQLVEL